MAPEPKVREASSGRVPTVILTVQGDLQTVTDLFEIAASAVILRGAVLSKKI